MADASLLPESNVTAVRAGWLEFRTVLRHLAIVTYAVPAERLARHIPPQAELVTYSHQGRTVGLVSAVAMQQTGLHYAWLPLPRLSFPQLNYRVYVNYQGEPAVFFLGSVVDQPFAGLTRRLWRVPWHRGAIALDADMASGEGRYSVRSLSSLGEGSFSLRGRAPAEVLPPFRSRGEMLRRLTHPLLGLSWEDGGCRVFRITHPPLQADASRLVSHRLEPLHVWGILKPGEGDHPHSVLYVPRADFRMYLPPALHREPTAKDRRGK